MSGRVGLREAEKFHGHLGPYLVLGILAGELAAKKLGFKKYFGLYVKVCGANKKPKSCLIDGLQISTGATYGKGNIKKFDGTLVKIEFRNCNNNKKIILTFNNSLIKELENAKTHKDCQTLAQRLYHRKHSELFNLHS